MVPMTVLRWLVAAAVLLGTVLWYSGTRPSTLESLRADAGSGHVAVDGASGLAVVVESDANWGDVPVPARGGGADSASVYDLRTGHLLHRTALWPASRTNRYVERSALASARLGLAYVLTVAYSDPMAGADTSLAIVDLRGGQLLHQITLHPGSLTPRLTIDMTAWC